MRSNRSQHVADSASTPDSEPIRCASAAARGGPNSAMAVALAEIGAAFDEAAIVNGFKIKVERLIASTGSSRRSRPLRRARRDAL